MTQKLILALTAGVLLIGAILLRSLGSSSNVSTQGQTVLADNIIIDGYLIDRIDTLLTDSLDAVPMSKAINDKFVPALVDSAPAAAPAFIGQLYIDTVGIDSVYIGVGTGVTDWLQLQ